MDQPLLVSKLASSRRSIPVEALTLRSISEGAEGALKGGNPEHMIHGLATDSRTVQTTDLFVALKGDRFDGHDFVGLSAQRGASGAIVDRSRVFTRLPDNFALIEVDDTLQAYQRVATAYRRSLPLKVVAITGSNGKTSTKDLTASVLSRQFRVAKTMGNLNNHIGVPQTLLSARANDQILVLEIGMNHPGEIAPLAAMAHPDTAVITNIGSAHIEFMKSRAAIAQEKGTLAEAVDSSGYVIMPADDDFTASIKERTMAQLVTVGFTRGDLRAESVVEGRSGSDFQIVEDHSRFDVRLPIPGLHMVINALLAVAVGRVHGMSLSDCAQGLETARLTKGRLELKSVAGLQILDDSYNANPDSMIAALKTLARMPTKGRRFAVLGRMGELGEFSESGHRQVGDAAARERIDHLITVGAEADFIAQSALTGGMRHVTAVSDITEAAQCLNKLAQADDLILIKGSRSAAMENIIAALTNSNSMNLGTHTTP